MFGITCLLFNIYKKITIRNTRKAEILTGIQFLTLELFLIVKWCNSVYLSILLIVSYFLWKFLVITSICFDYLITRFDQFMIMIILLRLKLFGTSLLCFLHLFYLFALDLKIFKLIFIFIHLWTHYFRDYNLSFNLEY